MSFNSVSLYTEKVFNQLSDVEREGIVELTEENISQLEGKLLRIVTQRPTKEEAANLYLQVKEMESLL
jgi:hypothetical protein